MAKIFIAKLDADTKHKICHKELSLEQLKFIYSILFKEQKRKHKAFQAAVCLTLLILAILLILTFFSVKNQIYYGFVLPCWLRC